MKCERCVEQGLRSQVYAPMSCVTTAVAYHPFYDVDGVYHIHDGNRVGEQWFCSKGHRWHRSYQSQCPALNCEWNKGRKDSITWEDDAKTQEPG